MQRRGIDCTIYEAAPELREVGAGIWMATNALCIADKLEVADDIIRAGYRIERGGLCDAKGRDLQMVDNRIFERKYGYGTISIHRGRLQAVLASHVVEGVIHLDHRLSLVDENGERIKLYFDNGKEAECDILIGADGVKSVVRKKLLGEIPFRYSGQTCWRGIVDYKLLRPEQSSEHWGASGGLRVAACQISDSETYFYITQKTKAGGQDEEGSIVPYLLELIKEFPTFLSEVVGKAQEGNIIRSDLHDIPPIKRWHADNIVLVGDAAHPSTPNLGQGGCQAMEDAYTLAECLSTYSTPMEAFVAYERHRMSKAKFVVNTSYQLALASNIGGTLGWRVRNFILRSVPEFIGRRQFDYLYKI